MNLRPSQVVLDPENPRLPDGTTSDREAINRLLDEGADALINLARDMAQTGQTNPAELPIVIKQGSKYLVLEGNRRFAALKLLQDPALADDETLQKAFQRATALGKPPATVFTLVAPSREDADHWIVLRHTGENSGRGIKRWSAGQTATHRRRANKTVDSGTVRSIVIADELEEVYAADPQLSDLIRGARREKLTNIGRFFSPDVLSALHLSVVADLDNAVRDKTLWSRYTADSLRDFFAWAFAFIVNNSVDAYKNADIRKEALKSASHLIPSEDYASSQPFRLVERSAQSSSTQPPQSASTKTGGTAATSGASQPGSGSSSGNSAQAQTTAQSNQSGAAGSGVAQNNATTKKKVESKPEQFVLQGLKLPNHPARVQMLLREFKTFEIEQAPGIACVMLRVIVELSVSCPPVLALSGAQEGDQLRKKILAVLRYLDPNIEHPAQRDKELAQAYMEAADLGVQYLNSFVHNPQIYPDQHLARRFSTAFRPMLTRVDGAI